jgi:selenocysteine lyase/cysteine desulfurase
MSEEIKKEEPKLTEEEIDQYSKMEYNERSRLNIYGELQQKFANTIKGLEEDLKSMEGIHRFMQEGVLVNEQIILSAKPDSSYAFRSGLTMRVLGQVRGSITVYLTLEDAKRLLKMLPAIIEASRKLAQLVGLKELYKNKTTSTRRW